jgi:DNA mismatch repair ATPase MutS
VESAGCKTLFITHYPLLASDIAGLYREVANEHMGFVEESRAGGLDNLWNAAGPR